MRPIKFFGLLRFKKKTEHHLIPSRRPDLVIIKQKQTNKKKTVKKEPRE